METLKNWMLLSKPKCVLPSAHIHRRLGHEDYLETAIPLDVCTGTQGGQTECPGAPSTTSHLLLKMHFKERLAVNGKNWDRNFQDDVRPPSCVPRNSDLTLELPTLISHIKAQRLSCSSHQKAEQRANTAPGGPSTQPKQGTQVSLWTLSCLLFT